MAGRPFLIAKPATQPVILQDVKTHLRVDHADDDTLITGYIDAAIDWLDGFDGYLGRGIILQDWALPLFSTDVTVFPIFPDAHELTIQRESAGSWSPVVGTSIVPQPDGWIRLSGLPSDMSGVALTMKTGWADAAAVPAAIKQAIMLLVGQWYELREAIGTGIGGEPPYSVRALLAPYRVQVPL